MYINAEVCRKARVYKVDSGRKLKLFDGIAVGCTNLGAYIYDPKEQEGTPVWAEWYPFFNSPLYCEIDDTNTNSRPS